MEFFYLALSSFRRYFRLREPLDPVRYMRTFHPYFKLTQIALQLACMIFFSSTRNFILEAVPTPFMVIVAGENSATFLLNLLTVMIGLFLEDRVSKIKCVDLFHLGLGIILYIANFFLVASIAGAATSSTDLNKIIRELFGEKSTFIDALTAYPTINLLMQIIVYASISFDLSKIDRDSAVSSIDVEAERETDNPNPDNLEPLNDPTPSSSTHWTTSDNHETLAFKAKRLKLQKKQEEKQQKKYKYFLRRKVEDKIKKKQRSLLKKKVQFNSKPEHIDIECEQEPLLDDELNQTSIDKHPVEIEDESESVESNDDYVLVNDDDDDDSHDDEINYDENRFFEESKEDNLLEKREYGDKLQNKERNSKDLSFKERFDDGSSLVFEERRKDGYDELHSLAEEKDEGNIHHHLAVTEEKDEGNILHVDVTEEKDQGNICHLAVTEEKDEGNIRHLAATEEKDEGNVRHLAEEEERLDKHHSDEEQDNDSKDRSTKTNGDNINKEQMVEEPNKQ